MKNRMMLVLVLASLPSVANAEEWKVVSDKTETLEGFKPPTIKVKLEPGDTAPPAPPAPSTDSNLDVFLVLPRATILGAAGFGTLGGVSAALGAEYRLVTDKPVFLHVEGEGGHSWFKGVNDWTLGSYIAGQYRFSRLSLAFGPAWVSHFHREAYTMHAVLGKAQIGIRLGGPVQLLVEGGVGGGWTRYETTQRREIQLEGQSTHVRVVKKDDKLVGGGAVALRIDLPL